MDPRLVTSVLSVASVLLSLAHGFPQESSAELLTKSSPLDDLTQVSALEDVKTSPLEKSGEKRETPDLPKSEASTPPGAKLKVRFPSEDAKLGLPLKGEDGDDDSVRALRQSPSLNYGHGPPITTVCIQVRSDTRPGVVCGLPVEGSKEVSPSARYAYPEYYSRATPQYAGRYAQKLPPPLPMGPPPTAVRAPIYPARRREDEVSKPMEQMAPQAPIRLVGPPQPMPLIPARQQYLPIMSPSLYPQASQLLRLNCGVQPDGTHLLNSPLLRSSSSVLMGYYPVGEQLVTLQDGSSALRARMASDGQNYLLNQEYAYPTADPWAGAAYPVGEGGFYTVDMQGRSAGGGVDQQYNPDAIGYSAEPPMDESARSLLQEQELQQSRLRLRMLQDQLRELHQRASADEALKDSSATDTTSHIQDQQTKDQIRPSKRQTKLKEI